MFHNFLFNSFKHSIKTSNISSINYNIKNLAALVSLSSQKLNTDTIQVASHIKPLINRGVNEILSDVCAEHTSPSESVTYLKALRIHMQFNNVPAESFNRNSKFQILCDVFQNNCNVLNFNLLISGLRCLLDIGVSLDSPCVVNAEKEVLINCHKFTIFNLIRCLHFHHKFTNNDLQKEVVNSLKEQLLNRVPEVSSSAEVLLLCQLFHLFSETNQKKIELKIIELLPKLSLNEICKVLILLAQKSNRNTTILNAITFHLRQKKENLSLKDVIDVLYALKKLNYFDQKLMTYLLNPVSTEIPSITQPSMISAILSTCGHLRWRDIDLLDACAEWIKSNMNICRTREFIAFVLSSAILNYSTSKSRSLIKSILPFLTVKQIDCQSVLLDVAWSLAILNEIPKKLLLHVLSPEFYTSLLNGKDTQIQITNKLKLMNLKGVLQMKYPEHVFGCNLYLEPVQLKESSAIENSRRHVVNVLSNFVPKNNCLCTHQSNDMGFFIDAEFIMDKNVKPLRLLEFGVIADARTKPKYLPKGAKRYALLVMFHKDYTLKLKILTGINALAVKLLTHHGYCVLQISYDDFMKIPTELEKAKFLMKKIKALSQTNEKS